MKIRILMKKIAAIACCAALAGTLVPAAAVAQPLTAQATWTRGYTETLTVSTGCITVSGWAIDDSYSGAIYVDIYIGGTLAGSLLASNYRSDVGYHGFSGTIYTNKYGNQQIVIYAVKKAAENTADLGTFTKNIPRDTTSPTISNLRVSNITSTGYTVTANVSDNVKVKEVKFPSWNASTKTSDNAVWKTGTVSNGVATCNISFSELAGGRVEARYVTHVYAYDYAGNSTLASSPYVYYDVTSPTFSNVSTSNVSPEGFTVICKVSDNVSGVSSVKATATANSITKTVTATLTGGYYSATFKSSDFGNYHGTYSATIAATDNNSNSRKYTSLPSIFVPENPSTCTHANHTVTELTPAQPGKNGSLVADCPDCASTQFTTIYAPKTLCLSASSRICTGSAIRPTVTVLDAAGKVIPAANYTVNYLSNVKPGTANVTITFKGSNYSGTLKSAFKITLGKVNLNKPKVKGKKATFKWAKVPGASKYQLQISKKKTFPSKKTTKKKFSSSKVSASGMKAGTYYVRVRAQYGTLTGSWSKVKKIVIK